MPLSSRISCRILSGNHCHPPAMRTRPPGWFWRIAWMLSVSSWSASCSPGQGSYTIKSARRKKGQKRSAQSAHLTCPGSPPARRGQFRTSWSLYSQPSVIQAVHFLMTLDQDNHGHPVPSC